MNTSGNRLTEAQRDAARGMLARGDRIQDVAYYFGISPSTAHAIKKSRIPYIGLVELPPPGPYQLVAKEGLAIIEAKAAAYDEARAKQEAAVLLVNELKQLLAKYSGAVALPSQSSGDRYASVQASLCN